MEINPCDNVCLQFFDIYMYIVIPAQTEFKTFRALLPEIDCIAILFSEVPNDFK